MKRENIFNLTNLIALLFLLAWISFCLFLNYMDRPNPQKQDPPIKQHIISLNN